MNEKKYYFTYPQYGEGGMVTTYKPPIAADTQRQRTVTEKQIREAGVDLSRIDKPSIGREAARRLRNMIAW